MRRLKPDALPSKEAVWQLGINSRIKRHESSGGEYSFYCSKEGSNENRCLGSRHTLRARQQLPCDVVWPEGAIR